ncbi:hypothetical protein Tco_0417725 [Tanacetum coccineum]
MTQGHSRYAEITRKRMMEKMKSPLCVENKVRIDPPDYSKENLLATFAPQRNLTPEQIFWSIDENDRKKAETSVPKPLSALTNTKDKQCAEIVKKTSIENENMIANCLSNQLLYDVEKSRCLDLEAEVSRVHNESKHISKLEREYLNLQLKYQHLQESFDNNKSQTSQEAPDFNSFFKIKNLEHQIQEKDNVIRDLKVLVSNVNDRSCEPYNANDIEDLKAQLEGNLKVATRSSVKTKVLAPGMYAIDVKPIPHPLKNNRSAHLTYINHLKESVETVREIVEEARAKKQVTFNDKPGTSSSNTQKHEVHQKVQQTNIPVIPSTGVNTSTEASGSKPRSNTKKNRILPAKTENKKKVEDHPRTNNHEMCVVNILNSVNATPTVKIVLNKGKQIWKPKGKLSDNRKKVALGKLNCGYQWRPTGKKFALGEMCPLTKLSVQCRTGHPLVSGLTAVSTGPVRFGNDHFGAIMGYGDYVIDHPRTNKSVWTKVNRVDSSISSKHVVINSNSESVCKTCNKCLNSANHEMCVVNILSSVNATPTVKIVLNKGKQIWKPKGKLSDNSLNKTKQVWKATGKLFANVGYQWRPTGKKFALGELCPLTRLPVTCTTVSANQQDPNTNWGSEIPNPPNSTVFKCRWRLLASLQASFLKEKKGIRKGNLLLDLQKLQKNPIFRISVDIRQNTNFVRAFTTSANVPSIYIQLFWNTLTHDVKTGVYSFQVNEHWLTLSADLLRKALNVTPADSAHPFESPPAGKTDITFTRRRVPSNWLMKMKFNRLLNLIWMIMSTIYNKTTRKLPVVEVKGKGSATDRWIIASQDETTGPSVHPEDATSTKMVRETLSHADAESGGNSEKINSETDTEILNVGDEQGLAPSHVPATTNIPPTDKDLEILFQPMFDEYFEQSTDSEPVPTATVVNAPIVSTNTSVSTTIAQDAPSTSHLLSSLLVILLVFPQSTSGDVSLTEPNQVTQPRDHLRRWTKDHPLDNIVGNPSRPLVPTRKQLDIRCFVVLIFHTETVQSRNLRTSKDGLCRRLLVSSNEDEIHEFDRLRR